MKQKFIFYAQNKVFLLMISEYFVNNIFKLSWTNFGQGEKYGSAFILLHPDSICRRCYVPPLYVFFSHICYRLVACALDLFLSLLFIKLHVHVLYQPHDTLVTMTLKYYLRWSIAVSNFVLSIALVVQDNLYFYRHYKCFRIIISLGNVGHNLMNSNKVFMFVCLFISFGV